MIRMIKPIYGLILLVLLCFFACQNESKVFVGEWQDARTPDIKWEISKSGSSFSGKRISGEDGYTYDSEEWTFEIGEGGFPTLMPVSKDGSTLIYQAKQNRILRSPPGRTYVKVIKDKK